MAGTHIKLLRKWRVKRAYSAMVSDVRGMVLHRYRARRETFQRFWIAYFIMLGLGPVYKLRSNNLVRYFVSKHSTYTPPFMVVGDSHHLRMSGQGDQQMLWYKVRGFLSTNTYDRKFLKNGEVTLIQM